MKRSLVICTLAIILSLGFAVQAKDYTMTEKFWKYYITTTELEYSEEGELFLSMGLRKHDSGDQILLSSLKWGYGFGGIELTGYVDNFSFFDDSFDYLDTGGLFRGSIRTQVFNQDGLVLVIGASTNGKVNLLNEGMASNLGFYTDKALGDNLTLHNNLVCEIVDNTVIKRLYNGLSYRFNQHHALKAYLYTGFVEFDSLTNALNLVYRNDFYDPATFLSYFVLNEDNLLFGNAVELKPISDLIVTGYYEFNTEENDWLGFDLRKDFINYRLTGSYQFSDDESLLSGGIAYDLSRDLELKLEFDRYVEKDDVDYNDYVQVRSVVTYSI